MRAVILFILACLWGVASAEVYTWRDASGKIHYSDTPPPGVDAKKMRAGAPSTSSAASPSGAPARSVAEQDMEFRKRQTETDKARTKAEKERKEGEDTARNSAEAKRNLNAPESAQPLRRRNEAGESIPLDDEMRAQETDKARKSVQSWCK